MQNPLCNSASFILDTLGIQYTTELTNTYTCLVDDHATADKDICKIKDKLSVRSLSNLYMNLLVSWLINDEPITGFQIGQYQSGDYTPYLLRKPFKYDMQRFEYYYDGMPASPDNMMLIVQDTIYTEVAKNLYISIRANYKELITTLTAESSSRTISVFLRNYRDLARILEIAKIYNMGRDANITMLKSIV